MNRLFWSYVLTFIIPWLFVWFLLCEKCPHGNRLHCAECEENQ